MILFISRLATIYVLTYDLIHLYLFSGLLMVELFETVKRVIEGDVSRCSLYTNPIIYQEVV